MTKSVAPNDCSIGNYLKQITRSRKGDEGIRSRACYAAWNVALRSTSYCVAKRGQKERALSRKIILTKTL